MVTVKNLVKRYGDFCLDISMEIPAGTITGLIGKNGAGKSTTIKAILGLLKPDEGQVTVLGKEASSMLPKEKEQIGVALSDSGFCGVLDVEDVSKILKKMYRDFDEKAFLLKCQEMNLPTKKQVMKFSTGMKAKLRVLVALSHKAKILIMDEPTSGLDVEARMAILDMIREYMVENEDCCVLLTSHISTDLEGLCDDIYMIHGGKILLHEDTDTILGQYGILKVDEQKMKELDQQYILRVKKEEFGYSVLTNQKQFYAENYPGIVIENGKIDDLILFMTGGRK